MRKWKEAGTFALSRYIEKEMDFSNLKSKSNMAKNMCILYVYGTFVHWLSGLWNQIAWV